MFTIASFDVGKKNLAWYVEKTNNTTIIILDINIINIKNRNDLFSKLNNNKEIWNRCDYFIIESQHRFKARNNITMIQIAESIISWFSIFYKDKIVSYFKPSIRTKDLNYKKMSYYKRKKQSIEDTINFFEDNKLYYFVSFFKKEKVLQPKCLKKLYLDSKNKKLDDISDACMQCQVYKKKLKNKLN